VVDLGPVVGSIGVIGGTGAYVDGPADLVAVPLVLASVGGLDPPGGRVLTEPPQDLDVPRSRCGQFDRDRTDHLSVERL
jgi:hypothetical protein